MTADLQLGMQLPLALRDGIGCLQVKSRRTLYSEAVMRIDQLLLFLFMCALQLCNGGTLDDAARDGDLEDSLVGPRACAAVLCNTLYVHQ